MNELILAAAKDPGAVGELERQLDRALVFALGNRGSADLQARVLQVSDPVSQHTLIPLFSDESLVHALQSAVPEGRNLELLLVNPREIRRISAASIHVVLNDGTEIEYEVRL